MDSKILGVEDLMNQLLNYIAENKLSNIHATFFLAQDIRLG